LTRGVQECKAGATVAAYVARRLVWSAALLIAVTLNAYVAIVICNLIADVVVGVLDPRVSGRTFSRRGGERRAPTEDSPELRRPVPASTG
jgi:hypothetical protein